MRALPIRGWVAALLIVASLAACSSETGLLIEVSGSFAIPEEIDRLEFRVMGLESGTMAEESFDISTAWPHTLSVRPSGNANEAVTITVVGRKDDVLADQHILDDRFVEGEERIVRVYLGGSGSGDGGMDGGADGGVDAGMPDAGCSGDAECDDGDPCNGTEYCELGRCIVPGMPDCDDAVACTVDTCAARACSNTPDDSLCVAGDSCDPTTGCGGRVCTTDPDCDDGNFCNGMERCMDGGCLTDPAPDCGDTDACTSDTCGGAAPGMCLHATRDGDMDGHGDDLCAATGGVPADDCNDADDTIFPGAPESCNGADDNCDGACDEAFACCRGRTGPCTTTCGSTGTRVCGTACSWGACAPPAETCNGRDDDCNGSCDDGVGCCQGQLTTCMTSCGTSGSTTCRMDCTPGSCVSPPETCNGVDDDCDGMTDEGFSCVAGSTAPCTASCGTVGQQACSATCTLGACTPPLEVCGNAIDDDCDTMVDEGCMAGCTGTCAGSTAVTGQGGRYMATLGPGSETGSCGGAGSEANLHFTITSTSDVFISTHGSPVDTVVYVRSCSCTGTEEGCNDDADGRASSVLRLSGLAGGTYNIFVDTKAPMSGTIPVDVYVTPTATDGDRCGRARPYAGAPVSGSTCGRVSDATGACDYASSLSGPDTVYYFTVDTTRSVTFSTCAGGCTDYDSSLLIRRVCNSALTANRVACNDDDCRSGCVMGGPPRQSQVTATLTPGLYYVFVDGYGSACGNYTLSSTGL